jgi:hypothetical protein
MRNAFKVVVGTPEGITLKIKTDWMGDFGQN